MFRFADPLGFLLFLPLGLAAWACYRRGVRRGILFAPSRRVPSAGRTWRCRAAMVLPALYILGTALGVAALARPQTVSERVRRAADRIAIEMVVDVSGSMRALDLTEGEPTLSHHRTRLDAVKDVFDDFIAQRPDDLIGLVTFGGYAVTRAPLTSDHAALRHVLRGVEIPRVEIGRDRKVVDERELLTAIGEGLALACARLEKTEPESRIMVLLSDGESNVEDAIQPLEAAAAAAKLGIKVYTIGIGSSARMTPFKGRDPFGREYISYGNRVMLDEALLRRIAETTGGRYFNVLDAGGLSRAMEEINQLETTRVERDEYAQYREWFPWCLAPALCLVVLGAGLNVVIARRLL